jgi:hypothetical protein
MEWYFIEVLFHQEMELYIHFFMKWLFIEVLLHEDARTSQFRSSATPVL